MGPIIPVMSRFLAIEWRSEAAVRYKEKTEAVNASVFSLYLKIGAKGFEPSAFCSQNRRSQTKLSYAPSKNGGPPNRYYILLVKLCQIILMGQLSKERDYPLVVHHGYSALIDLPNQT